MNINEAMNIRERRLNIAIIAMLSFSTFLICSMLEFSTFRKEILMISAFVTIGLTFYLFHDKFIADNFM